MKIADKIFSITTPEQFSALALEVFHLQAERCAVYAQYLELIGVEPSRVERVEDIPMLPIELFKSHTVYSATAEPQVVFTSSATTGMTPSRHPVADLSIYERAFTEGFRRFYGDIEQWSIYGLLPSYLQRKGSSLIYMVDRLIAQCGSGGFYLDDYDKLLAYSSKLVPYFPPLLSKTDISKCLNLDISF